MDELDVAALTDPLDAESHAGRDRGAGSAGRTEAWGGCVVAALAAVALSVPAAVVAVYDVRWVLVVVAVWLVLAVVVVRHGRRQRQWAVERRHRLAAFARANGFDYVPEVGAPDRPGAIFDLGINRRTRDQVSMTRPRSIVLGQHSCTAGRFNAEVMTWGFASSQLDGVTGLPHLVLVSRRRRRGRAPVPLGPATPGEVAVRGPGAEAFVVHGPVGRRQQVQALLDRTLFRPEVLARLLERSVDLEVVDGHVVLLADETVSTDPDAWRRTLRLVNTVADALEAPTGPGPA